MRTIVVAVGFVVFVEEAIVTAKLRSTVQCAHVKALVVLFVLIDILIPIEFDVRPLQLLILFAAPLFGHAGNTRAHFWGA